MICAVPFLAFGALEAVVVHKRRRSKAIAQRSKSR